MTVNEYQQFLEFIESIDVLEGIDDFAPDWKPLTKEEYHDRYIGKIKAGIPEGKITQEMFDFWVNDYQDELDDADRLIAIEASINLFIKEHPEHTDFGKMKLNAIKEALCRGEHEVTIVCPDGIKTTCCF